MREIDHFAGLDRGFETKVREAMEEAQAEGMSVIPTCGLRPPWEQAKLWRGTRSKHLICRVIDYYQNIMPYVTSLIEDVGFQKRRENDSRLGWPFPIGHEMPALSSHQWGLALDFVLVPAPETNPWIKNIEIGVKYDRFAGIAERHDLFATTWGHLECLAAQKAKTSAWKTTRAKTDLDPADHLADLDRRCREKWGLWKPAEFRVRRGDETLLSYGSADSLATDFRYYGKMWNDTNAIIEWREQGSTEWRYLSVPRGKELGVYPEDLGGL